MATEVGTPTSENGAAPTPTKRWRFFDAPKDETPPGAVRAAAAPYGTARSMAGAAEVLNLNLAEKNRLEHSVQAWQESAWNYVDQIGELKFAFNIVSQVVSRAMLYPAILGDLAEVPTEVGEYLEQTKPEVPEKTLRAANVAGEVLTELLEAGQAEMLRLLAMNLSVPGECYLLKDTTWTIASTSELTPGTITYLNRSKKSELRRAIPKDTYVARLWRAHPRWYNEPDSSMLGVLDQAEKLVLFDQVIRAISRSRLGAGIVGIPSGLTPLTDGLTVQEALAKATVDPVESEAAAASVVPLLLTGPAEQLKELKRIDLSRPLDEPLLMAYDSALDRLLAGLDIPKNIVTGLADVKYCADEQTEVLTKDGWVNYTALAIGDEILTLNPETGLSEWNTVDAVNVFDTDGSEMVSIEQRGHSSLTTKNHRWLVDGKFILSEDISGGTRIPACAPHADLPQEAKWTDSTVELAAWFFTEGHFRNRKAVVSGSKKLSNDDLADIRTKLAGGSPQRSIAVEHQISQSMVSHINTGIRGELVERPGRYWSEISQSPTANPTGWARIKRALYNTFGDEGWAEVSHGFRLNTEALEFLGQFFEDCTEVTARGNEISAKVIRRDFLRQLTQAQLDLFIDTALDGDGHRGALWQKNEARLDSFEYACHLAGRRTVRTPNRVAIHRADQVYVKGDRIGTVTHTGKVWCPTTKNLTWFARRNGTSYFTGNSNALVIDDALYKAHIEPLLLLICDCLTNAYLRPRLRKEGVDEKLVKRMVVWYNPSQIVTRPDRSQAASEGYEKMLLSGKAWRAARGFAETDAPDDDEIIWRKGLDAQVPGEMATVLIEQLHPEFFAKLRQAGREEAGVPPEVSDILDGGTGTADNGLGGENNTPSEPGQVPAAKAPNDPMAGGEIQPGGTLPPRPTEEILQ